MAAEAVHRHNFPARCRPPKKQRKKTETQPNDRV
jgi:hypothetical protein